MRHPTLNYKRLATLCLLLFSLTLLVHAKKCIDDQCCRCNKLGTKVLRAEFIGKVKGTKQYKNAMNKCIRVCKNRQKLKKYELFPRLRENGCRIYCKRSAVGTKRRVRQFCEEFDYCTPKPKDPTPAPVSLSDAPTDSPVPAQPMTWKKMANLPAAGRHHPITFSNKTHAFVLGGTTPQDYATIDFWLYDAEADTWTDLTNTDSAYPGEAISFAYGVASTTDCGNTKAYLGLGVSNSDYLQAWWVFDMVTHIWKRLADFPGTGRKHPAMNFIEDIGEIQVGLGNERANLKDYWSYSIENDSWRRLDDFPGSERHHPFYFAIGPYSYVGFGHANSNGPGPNVKNDWYRYDTGKESWYREKDFASYELGVVDIENAVPVSTEARVAGTQLTVAESCNSNKTLGFVLSGDGSNHGFMDTGEFHVYNPETSVWHRLPPHPGKSRWAPGSFVQSSRVFFFAGFDRFTRTYYSDLWMIDVQSLFEDK